MKSPNVLNQALVLALAAGGTLVPNAFADREKAGNGGNAAVCFNSSAEVKRIKANDNRIANDQLGAITSIKALDLYQAEAAFKGVAPAKNLILPKPGEDGTAYVARIAKRYEKTLPTLQDAIVGQAATFNPKKNTYYTEGGIDRIYDTAEKYYLEPSKCVVATLIRRTTVGGQAELEYDWRLFNHRAHKNESRGILMLHEVVYKWASDLKQEDSFNTRRLLANAILRRDVGRDETVRELQVDGFNIDAASKGATAEYRAMGSIDAPLADLEKGKFSPEAEARLNALVGSLGFRVYVDSLPSIRYSMVSFRKADGILEKLPKPKAAAAAQADQAVQNAKGWIEKCKSPQSKGDKRYCRDHADELPSQLAQAENAAVAAHAEADREVAENRVKAEDLRAAVSRELEAEFLRLSEKAPGMIADYLDRIPNAPWFDTQVASGLRDYGACLRQYFAVNLPGSGWDTPSASCRGEDAVFRKVWANDRAIPVVE